MKRLLAALTVATLIPFAANATDLPAEPFVVASGSASTEISPDIASISFYVKLTVKDLEKGLADLDADSQSILSIIDEMKIDRKDVTAHSVSKNQHIDEKTKEAAGYDLSRNFQISIRKLSDFEPFMKRIMNMPTVESIYESFDRSDRVKIEADLMGKACQDAKTQAESMAKAFGSELGKVRGISPVGFKNIGDRFLADGERGLYDRVAGSSNMLFVPASICFGQSVSVIYSLK